MALIGLKPKNSFIGENGEGEKKISKISNNQKLTPTIISKDLVIDGEVFSEGVVEIEGTIKGNVKGNNVILRENGSIIGSVIADSITIKGNFNGSIKANHIIIASSANISGEFEYILLSVEDGACIDGQFKKVNSF